MRKNLCLFFLVFGVWVGFAGAENFPNIERFDKTDRVLVLSPHPDDETIACAGIIQQAKARGADLRVAYLTYGEHNELAFIVYRKLPPITRWDFASMGQVRRNEAIKAMKYLGLSEDKLIFLGYPDFGTFDIFSRYWQTNSPFWSIMTRISAVPYKNALSPGAPYVGESILKDLKGVLLKFRPNKIFVSHAADVNVDHKTLYLFLQVALADLKKELPKPRVYSYLVHAYGWPMPRHLHPLLTLDPPQDMIGTDVAWWKFRLSPQQLKNKHRAVLFYPSQTNSSAFYLLSFVRKNELFGDFTAIDLTPEQKKPAASPEKTNRLWDFACMMRSFLGLSGKCLTPAPSKSVSLPRASGPVKFFIEDGNLMIRVQKSKATAKNRAACWIYLFGYNYKTPFERMPKLYILTLYDKIRAFDGPKMVEMPGASMVWSERELNLKVPLKALGEPDFILASVKAYTGVLPIYTSGFRRINLTREAQDDRIEVNQN